MLGIFTRILTFLVGNPKIAMALGVALALAVGAWWFYHRGSEHAETKALLKGHETALKIQEAKDEIRNSRSFELYVGKLLRGNF